MTDETNNQNLLVTLSAVATQVGNIKRSATSIYREVKQALPGLAQDLARIKIVDERTTMLATSFRTFRNRLDKLEHEHNKYPSVINNNHAGIQVLKNSLAKLEKRVEQIASGPKTEDSNAFRPHPNNEII